MLLCYVPLSYVLLRCVKLCYVMLCYVTLCNRRFYNIIILYVTIEAQTGFENLGV